MSVLSVTVDRFRMEPGDAVIFADGARQAQASMADIEARAVKADGKESPGFEWPYDTANRGDALALLQSLASGSAAAAFFDPQHRTTLARLQYGNEGSRQRARCALPQMADSYIDACCRGIARVLRPSGYLMLWTDTVRLCEGDHLRVKDALPCVDLIAWDNQRIGQGYRSRRRGGYLLVLTSSGCRNM
jgi:site-specific DNA-methyltransferase (adenine-specific)